MHKKLISLLTVLGAATVLVLAANTVTYAATGHSFILGKANKANQVTTLKRTTSGQALSLVTKSSSNAPLAVNGKGKVANLNADRLDGLDSTKFVRNGNHGVARAYAHILPGSGFDAARSWNVSAADVVSSNGSYCFRNLGFTPRSGAVTADYNGVLNGQVAVTELKLPAEPADCSIASADAEVFTGLVSPGVFTSGGSFGFYVVFY
jgi:hypothetical protein